MNFLKKHQKATLGILTLLSFSLYFLAASVTTNLHSSETFIDQYIPVVPVFVIPYLFFFFPYVIITNIYFLCISKNFKSFAISMILNNVISFIIYITYQTTIIQPAITGNDIFSNLIRTVYANDLPTRCFPSNHTSDSVLLLLYWLPVLKNKWIKIALIIAVLSVVAATVLIKQHYFMDIVGGIILALACYKIPELIRKHLPFNI